MGALVNPKRQISAQVSATKKAKAVAANLLQRLKPFDQWVAERNPSASEKEMYWWIVASLRTI